LGRGGGGEVVKVRRPDRRIYAVKKILLESERGKYGALQNQKPRRKPPLLRMTHKKYCTLLSGMGRSGGEFHSTGR
jgi:hypothetical protein